jgi:hypothetical protein
MNIRQRTLWGRSPMSAVSSKDLRVRRSEEEVRAGVRERETGRVSARKSRPLER